MEMNGKLVLIGARIPDYIVKDWIAYCRSKRLTQSETIRRAIARYIEADEAATNQDLVVAATIEDVREYRPRSAQEYNPQLWRWRGSL